MFIEWSIQFVISFLIKVYVCITIYFVKKLDIPFLSWSEKKKMWLLFYNHLYVYINKTYSFVVSGQSTGHHAENKWNLLGATVTSDECMDTKLPYYLKFNQFLLTN